VPIPVEHIRHHALVNRDRIGRFAAVAVLAISTACSAGSHGAAPTTTASDQPVGRLTTEACDLSNAVVSFETPAFVPDFVVRVRGTMSDLDALNSRLLTRATTPTFAASVDVIDLAVFVAATNKSPSGLTDLLARLQATISDAHVSADLHRCAP
jgi:hypothetical protein